jgi:hypothetical protein
MKCIPTYFHGLPCIAHTYPPPFPHTHYPLGPCPHPLPLHRPLPPPPLSLPLLIGRPPLPPPTLHCIAHLCLAPYLSHHYHACHSSTHYTPTTIPTLAPWAPVPTSANVSPSSTCAYSHPPLSPPVHVQHVPSSTTAPTTACAAHAPSSTGDSIYSIGSICASSRRSSRWSSSRRRRR